MIDITLISQLSVYVFCGLCCFGWGGTLFWIYRSDQWRTPFFTTSIGLAIICFLGGILNSLRIASLMNLWLILILGICLMLFQTLLKPRRPQRQISFRGFTPADIFMFFLVLITMIVLLKGICISQYFNSGDDLLKYFARPLRMIQTGTLGGDPFNAQGMDSLGGHDFFNAFVLLFGGLELFNNFDAIFCLILCLLLLRDAAVILGCPVWSGCIAALFCLLIPPQQVNISSLYSSVLMIMTFMLVMIRLNSIPLYPRSIHCLEILPAALCCSAALSFKNTLIFFLFLYTLGLFIYYFIKRQYWLVSFYIIIVILCMIPWLWVNKQIFVAGGRSAEISSIMYGGSLMRAAKNFLHLFSNEFLFYGGHALIYSYLTLMSLILLVLKYFRQLLTPKVFPLSLGSMILIGLYFVYPFVMPFDLGIRYMIPIFIPVVSLVLILVMSHLTWKRRIDRIIIVLIVFSLFFTSYFFLPEFSQRLDGVVENKTILSFPYKYWRSDRKLLLQVLPSRCHDVINLQEKVPPGRTILYWASDPYALDFRRNRIFMIGGGTGLTARWLGLELTMQTEQLKQWLKRYEIEYIIWENRSRFIEKYWGYKELSQSPYIVRKRIGQYACFLLDHLHEISGQSKIIYHDGQSVIVELQ